MDDVATRMNRRHLQTAARWFGLGLAAAPVLDVADDSGLLNALLSPGTGEWDMMLGPVLWVVLFVVLGGAAGLLLARHRPGARGWFFAAGALPIVLYVLYTGLRFSGAIALIALAFSAVQLRLVEDP